MERMSLLEKLKTLNQWQLQQQLHLAKLQADVNDVHRQSGSQGENPDDHGMRSSPHMPDKENVHSDNSKQFIALTQTMSKNSLTNALRNIDLNKIDSVDYVAGSQNLQQQQQQQKQQQMQQQQNRCPQHNSPSLDHWNMSGLQTAKFMPQIESTTTAVSMQRHKNDQMQESDTPIFGSIQGDFHNMEESAAMNKQNIGQYNIENYNTEGEGEFSGGEFFSDISEEDGVKPIPETDTDMDGFIHRFTVSNAENRRFSANNDNPFPCITDSDNSVNEFQQQFLANNRLLNNSRRRMNFKDNEDDGGVEAENMPYFTNNSSQHQKQSRYFKRSPSTADEGYTDENHPDWGSHVSRYLGMGEDVRMTSEGDDNDASEREENPFYGEGKEQTILEVDNYENGIVENQPIKSKLNESAITFEEMVENELENELETMETKLNTSTPMKKKKHKFLKRGEGLKRFQRGNIIQSKEKAERLRAEKKRKQLQKSEKKAMQFTIDAPPPKPMNQQESKNNNKHNVRSGLPSKLKLRRPKNSGENPAITNFGAKPYIAEQSSGTSTTTIKQTLKQNETSSSKEHEIQSKSNAVNATNHDGGNLGQNTVSSSILEASFQKMLMQYNEREEVENKELDDFEALEEAAENMSLSSNSSLVVKLMGRRNSQQSTEESIEEDKEEDLMKTRTEKKLQSEILSQMAKLSNDSAVNERPPSFEFEDDASWSDSTNTSIFTDNIDDTIIREPSPEINPTLTPPKRIISKKKDVQLKNETDLNSSRKSLGMEFIISSSQSPYRRNADSAENHDDVSQTVKKKLAELEKQIKKFRLENEKLETLRVEREKEIASIKKDTESFQKKKHEELGEIENYKNEEMKKLKIERKVFEKYQKASKEFPNKHEREEIKELRQEVDKLKEEMKTREARFNSATHRFRSRINELEEENYELRLEIKLFEEERLERWKRSTRDSFKNTGRKNGKISVDPTSVAIQGIINSQLPKRRSIETLPRSPPVKESWSTVTSPTNSNTLRDSPNTSVPTEIDTNSRHKQEVRHENGKTEILLPDQSRLITFPNGTKKTISPDGKTVSVCFFNGDVKKILPDGRVVYFYAESQTTHTTLSDGLEILEFPNKQTEKRYPNGRTEVIFPDGTIKYLSPDGSEETIFLDGTVQNTDKDNVRTISFPNGQREVHTAKFKRREYPNGTVKTVYEDGRQETKYSNGRLRVKDKKGTLLIDIS